MISDEELAAIDAAAERYAAEFSAPTAEQRALIREVMSPFITRDDLAPREDATHHAPNSRHTTRRTARSA